MSPLVRRLAGLAAAGVVAAGTVVGLGQGQAKALNSGNILCNMAGTIVVGYPATNQVSLTINQQGRCDAGGDNFGPYNGTLKGFGTAGTIGSCGSLPLLGQTLGLVTALNVKSHLHMVSVTSARTLDFDLVFQLPVDVFPRLTAYLVFQSGKLQGAGTATTSNKACTSQFKNSAATLDFDFDKFIPV
jgi:ribose 5-phosphate isomerase